MVEIASLVSTVFTRNRRLVGSRMAPTASFIEAYERSVHGMALHKGVRPYGGTFFVFTDYLRPAIRLACLMKLPVVYVFTHDSIAVGEDGPTHQPVEHVAALRAIPNLTVLRPGDANETAMAWQLALNRKDGPTALVLTRQKLPIIDRGQFASEEGLQKGGYILADAAQGAPQALILASG